MKIILADKVNCNGCTACCRNDLIMLHPECGDDPNEYQTVEAMDPISGKPGRALARAANGDCIYLDREKGCTIWGKHPAICREFNCVKMMQRLSRAERRRALAVGMISKEVFEAARHRMKETA